MMICIICGRDIDAIGQDNCSCIPGMPLCEDCANGNIDYFEELYDNEEVQDEVE